MVVRVGMGTLISTSSLSPVSLLTASTAALIESEEVTSSARTVTLGAECREAGILEGERAVA